MGFFQSNPYGLKESGPPGADMGAWTSAGPTGYYPYDPALAAYGYVLYTVFFCAFSKQP